MRQLAYSLYFDSDPSRICESIGLKGFPAAVPHDGWTDDELNSIRLVLRKLTALRVGNPADAEDLVQETLLTMLRKTPEGDLEKGRLIWAMGILRRKVGNYYRRAQRFTLREEQVRYAWQGSSSFPTPESNLHHAELVDKIEGILLGLPPNERRPVDLYLAGRETGEIVSALRPERYQNIVNRLHRGRRKVARELARYGYEREGLCKLRKRKPDMQKNTIP